MSRRTALAFVMLAALGCDSEPGPAPAKRAPVERSLRPAPEPNWSDETLGKKLEFADESGKLSFRVVGSYGDVLLGVRGSSLPDDTVVRVGEATAKAESGSLNFDAPLEFALGAVELKDATDSKRKVDLGVELQFEFPGHEPLVVKLPPMAVRFAVTKSLETIATGSIAFHDEPAAEGERDTLAELSVHGHLEKIHGSGKLVQDIDLIALEERVDSGKTKVCRGYTSGSITFSLFDSKMTVYDRRTGDVVVEEMVKAKPKCPSMAMTADNTAKIWVSTEAKGKWIADQLRKLQKNKGK